MNKPLSGSVVAEILSVVAVIVGVLAWKLVLAPPAPNPVIPMTREQFQEVLRQNAESVDRITAEQLRRYAEVHKGWRPGAVPSTGGYRQRLHQTERDSVPKR